MKFWIHITKAYWKHLRGGWYVWRDVPIDVVAEAAAMHDKALDDEQDYFLAGAVAELKLRSERESK